MTLGLLDRDQATQLKQAGLDYYNHNVDTSPEYYDKIITTRTFEDRLQTIGYVREVGMKVCCGGILGMGETQQDRGSMLRALANLEEPPESVPINMLVPIPGTPLEGATKVEPLEFIRTIAVARIMLQNQCFGFQRVDEPCLKNFRRCVSLLVQTQFCWRPLVDH